MPISEDELLLVQELDPEAVQKVEVQLGHVFGAVDGLVSATGPESLCFGFGTWS